MSGEAIGGSHGDGSYRLKRVVDFVVVALTLIPAVTLGVIAAAAIRVSSRGPILFRQERVGMGGRPFTMLKFRTMIDGDNPIIPSDDCITAVGRVLRRLSLDELPQLINVVLGDMSVVGPRPTLAYQTQRWSDRQRGRLAVRPGLTGLAQVNGRNDLAWTDRIEFDLAYVEQQSVAHDLAIIARTATTMIGGRGAGATAADDPIAQMELDNGFSTT